MLNPRLCKPLSVEMATAFALDFPPGLRCKRGAANATICRILILPEIDYPHSPV